MKDRKILFTDLDGTLFTDTKEVTEGNRFAIRELLNQGHCIALTSGRALSSVLLLAESLGLDSPGCYIIACNGSLIYDLADKKKIFRKGVPIPVVKEIFRTADSMGLQIQTYTDTQVLTCRKTQDLLDYCRTVHMTWILADEELSALTSDPQKMLAISRDPDALRQLENYIPGHYPGILDAFYSNDRLLEIVPAGVNKGASVRYLCDYLHIPIENSVAAGDAQNDISMLEAAHVGAVMANAFPGTAEHGNYLTKADNNHDGLAEIIERFILS